MSDLKFCFNLSEPNDGDVLTWSEAENSWEPVLHEHVMNSLKDVISPSPNHGDILQLEQNGKDLWKPIPHLLNTLIDVEATSPNNEEVLTWDAVQKHWKPRQSQTGGDFVQIPPSAGPYAIIAAGFFDADGKPIENPYNQLEVDHINQGIYRLTSPYYASGTKDVPLTYIVKAIVMNPGLQDAYFEYGEEFGEGKFINKNINQASIQVSQLHDDFIELWITQPAVYLSGKGIQNIIKEDLTTQNMVQHEPIDMPFMVEISLYNYKDLTQISKRIDLNRATVKELEKLPRLGPALAKKIIATREARGEFKTIDDLIAIRGISRGAATEIRPFLTFGGKF